MANKPTASALRDPLDEMLSRDTRESIIAMANAVHNNMAVSGYKIAVPMLLQAAAWHSGKCTEHGVDALDWAEALMEVRHWHSSSLNPMDERTQQAYIAVTALEDELGSHSYKQVLLKQSQLVQAHLELPLEAMMAAAFGFAVYGQHMWPLADEVFSAYARLLDFRKYLAEQEAKRTEMLQQLIRKAGG